MDEAIKIGKMVRRLYISIYAKDYCASACFIIYASAALREGDEDAKFLLHRPYFDKSYYSGMSLADAKNKYKALTTEYENYLLSVGVQKSLLDEIMKYNSESALVKTGGEILNLIGRYAPFVEEWLLAKCGDLEEVERKDWYNYSKIGTITCNENAVSYAGISKGYCEYLVNKLMDIESCRWEVLQKERKKIYKSKM